MLRKENTSCLNFWDEACWFLSLSYHFFLSCNYIISFQVFNKFQSIYFDIRIFSFLSLRVFGLLSPSLLLLLFPQRFGRYILRPYSGVCRTREPSRNFELRPLLNPWRSPVLIPEFDKHLKKAGWHISRSVVEITITIKMKIIVRKPLMIKKRKYIYRNI